MAYGGRDVVSLEGRVGTRREVAVSPPVLVHLELLHRSDALVDPWVGHTQDGLVWEIHVCNSVADVRWVAWELLADAATVEHQTSRLAIAHAPKNHDGTRCGSTGIKC